MSNWNSAMPRGIPFSSAPALAASGEHFYVADGPDPEVRVWRGDGSLRRIVRWSMEPRTVGEDLVERYRDHLAETADDPEARRRNDAFLAEVQLPERLPATDGGAMLVDGEGNLWVPAYALPWEEASAWDVFSPEGEWLGPVSMPPRFTPWQIGRDFVIGSWMDELDVEYVLVYELVKPALRS
jgi:hypothetical protein